jgi:hypothetical protein
MIPDGREQDKYEMHSINIWNTELENLDGGGTFHYDYCVDRSPNDSDYDIPDGSVYHMMDNGAFVLVRKVLEQWTGG